MTSESRSGRKHRQLMWVGGAALLLWPSALTVHGIRDLSNTGMGGFVLVFVPLVLLVTVALWLPTAWLAQRLCPDVGAAMAFAAGAWLSQVTSLGLLLLFEATNTASTPTGYVVALVYFASPLIVCQRLFGLG